MISGELLEKILERVAMDAAVIVGMPSEEKYWKYMSGAARGTDSCPCERLAKQESHHYNLYADSM